MGDLISRSKTSDHIKNRMIQTAINNMEHITSYAKVCEDIVDNRLDTWINEVQAVESERKPGKWITKEGYDGDVYYDCSVCGNSWTIIDGTPWDNGMNYCPHCGARMEANK